MTLIKAYKAHAFAGHQSPTIRELLDSQLPKAAQVRQQEFIFSADECSMKWSLQNLNSPKNTTA